MFWKMILNLNLIIAKDCLINHIFPLNQAQLSMDSSNPVEKGKPLSLCYHDYLRKKLPWLKGIFWFNLAGKGSPVSIGD